MKCKKFLLISFLLAIAFSACKKEDRQKNFPTETTTGANTFGCYVGTYQFLPCKMLGGISPVKKLEASIYYDDSNHVDLIISATHDCETHDTLGSFIHLSFDSVEIVTGTTYKLGLFNTNHAVSIFYWENLNEFSSDSSLAGTLTVTNFDKLKKIISGKFEATLKNRDGNGTINITKGIFDVTF